MLFRVLLHITLCNTAVAKGIASSQAIKEAIEASKAAVNYMKSIGSEIIKEAQKTQEDIHKWHNDLEKVAEKDMRAFVSEVAVASSKLQDAQIQSHGIMQTMLNLTNKQIKFLNKSKTDEEWQKNIHVAKILLLAQLNTSTAQMKELQQRVMEAKASFNKVAADSRTYADMIALKMTPEMLKKKEQEIRMEAYIPCAAALIAAPICYAAAVPIIENRISQWEQALKESQKRLDQVKASFVKLEKTSKGLMEDSLKSLKNMTIAQDMMQQTKEVVEVSEDVYYWQFAVLDQLNDLQNTLMTAMKQ